MSSGTWFQSSLWAQMKASPPSNIIEIQESLFMSEKEMVKKPSGAGLSSVWVPGCLSVPSFLLAFPFLLWIWNMVGCVWLCKSFLSLAAIGSWRLTARSIPARTLGSSQTLQILSDLRPRLEWEQEAYHIHLWTHCFASVQLCFPMSTTMTTADLYAFWKYCCVEHKMWFLCVITLLPSRCTVCMYQCLTLKPKKTVN